MIAHNLGILDQSFSPPNGVSQLGGVLAGVTPAGVNSYNAIAKLDSTHYVNFHQSTNFDGFGKSFVIDLGINTIAQWGLGALEFDDVLGRFNVAIGLGTDRAFNIWQGDSGRSYAQIFSIDNLGNVSALGVATLLGVGSTAYQSADLIDSTHILCTWGVISSNTAGLVQILTIDPIAGTITPEPSNGISGSFLEFTTDSVVSCKCVTLSATHAVLVWRGGSNDDGRAQVITTNTSTGEINKLGNEFTFDSATGIIDHISVIKLDATHIAITWASMGNIGLAQIFEINITTGAIIAMPSNGVSGNIPLTHDPVLARFHSMKLINSTHLVLAYTGVGANGYAKILSFDASSGLIENFGESFEFAPNDGSHMDIELINSNSAIIFYAGLALEGKAVMISMTY